MFEAKENILRLKTGLLQAIEKQEIVSLFSIIRIMLIWEGNQC